jgi:8-oxo-dGTP diphosphatase
MTDDRLYPLRPILAVSLAVFRGDQVLIARRAKAPLRGLYSLPGGVVEIGETLQEAALRELQEEVGLRAEILGFNDHVESVVRDEKGVRAHYVIASFVGRWLDGEAQLSEETDSVLWVNPRESLQAPTTPGLEAILAKACKVMGRLS